ncbi:MAG: peptidyl-prolyl cis-trans isomerase D [Alphaproteobacteria bacterium]|jgi:peptidyl-prolyl cis-trans isomerase D
MFKDIKNKAKSIIAKVFMTVFALSFLSWGANSYFMNTPKSIAITVNGEEVSSSELQKEYETRTREAERQFGGKLSPEYLQAIRLGNRTVNNIITSKLTLDEAKKLGFRASKKALQEQISSNPAFRDAEGNFNKEAYKRTVQNYGYSVRGYENVMSEDMQKARLYETFATPFNNKAYLEQLFNFQNEKATIRVLHVNSDVIGQVTAPTASEIKSFYDENAHRYLTEEKRDFQVLVINAKDLKARANISMAEMQAVYNDNPESFASAEKRKASHILVDTEEKAIELIYRLDKGASFAETAKANSKDAFTKNKGGDLGFFLEGDMVESFSEAAFSMEKGAISEPIKSPFGYHIIQLNDIQEAAARSFAEVKKNIENELKIEKAEDLYYDLIENAEDQIASGSNLTEVGKALQLKVDNYKDLEQSDTTITFATEIMPVVYNADDMDISDAISIEGQDTVTVFTQVTHITKPRELTIDQAQTRVVTELNEITTQKLIAEKAQNLLVERQNEKSLDDVAAKQGLTKGVKIISGVSRTGEGSPKWLKQLHIKLLFSMKAGGKLNSLINTPDGMALVELVSIEEDKATAEDLEYFQQKIAREMQSDLFAQFMLQKRLNATIDLNIPSIVSTLGSGFVQ